VKTYYRLVGIAVAAAVITGSAARAAAQSSPPVIRGDAAVTIGWLAADTHASGPYNHRDWSSSLFGAASAGWHWTDNLKTEIDVGSGTEGHSYSNTQVTTPGRISYVTVESRFARRTLGVSQQYQFFHNTWFHPHVAAGANFTWERRTDEVGPIYYYDELARTTRFLEGGRTDGPRTSFTARPFVAVGYKAYLSERTFFRNDLRLAFHHGIDETVLRIGFGVDF